MKKLFCIILASLALISFAACSRGSGDRPSGATPTPAETMRDGTYTCRVNVTGGGELTFHDTAQVVVKNKEAVAHIVCTDRRVQYAAIGETKIMPDGTEAGTAAGEIQPGQNKDYPTFSIPAKFDTDVTVTFYYTADNGETKQADFVFNIPAKDASFMPDTSKR